MKLIVTLIVLKKSQGKLRYCPYTIKARMNETDVAAGDRYIKEVTQIMIDANIDMDRGEKLISFSHFVMPS